MGGLSLSHDRVIRFRRAQVGWESPAVVITCMDDTLLPTFCVLGLDVATRADPAAPPAARFIFSAMNDWERLFRSRRQLTMEEQLGLWGELWILSGMRDISAGVRAWQGPSGGAADFVFNEQALECKTTTQPLCHHVSQSQLERPYGDLPVFIVSLFVTNDHSGQSLPDLVHRITSASYDRASFETKLLAVGYSRLDAVLYRQRFTVADSPLIFPEGAVPRVRTYDPGIRAIRFTVQLDDRLALPADETARLLAGPTGIHAAVVPTSRFSA